MESNLLHTASKVYPIHWTKLYKDTANTPHQLNRLVEHLTTMFSLQISGEINSPANLQKCDMNSVMQIQSCCIQSNNFSIRYPANHLPVYQDSTSHQKLHYAACQHVKFSKAKRKTIKMTFGIGLVFLGCWTPHVILSIW